MKPACKPRTYQGYEVVVRVHLVPALGKKKLNKLTGADVRLFLRRLENVCLCCIHKTDQKRAEGERRCCAVGRCCKSLPSVRLRQQAHAVLRNALEAAVREERAYAGSDWVETGHVFTSVIGTPIEPDNLRRSWYPLREKIGAEGVRFHDLRHTCVTLLLHLGVPPHTVRDIAGHSAIEVTMTIYAPTSLGQMRDALSKLDDQLR